MTPRSCSYRAISPLPNTDYDAAEGAYPSIVAVQPWNSVARSDTARAQIATDKLKEAIVTLDALRKVTRRTRT